MTFFKPRVSIILWSSSRNHNIFLGHTLITKLVQNLLQRCVIKRKFISGVYSRQQKMWIISVEVMKATDKRERCDTRYVVMRWSNSEV